MKKFWIIKGILFFTAAVLLMGTATLYLWNWLVPALFSGPVISFWQAVGLLLLTRILFRGFFGMRGGHGWNRHHWRRHWEEKWKNMSPEQREQLRARWKARCGPMWGESQSAADSKQ